MNWSIVLKVSCDIHECPNCSSELCCGSEWFMRVLWLTASKWFVMALKLEKMGFGGRKWSVRSERVIALEWELSRVRKRLAEQGWGGL
jgi:hypothetical protein